MKLIEPIPARVLIEEDLDALKKVSEVLTEYEKTQTGDPEDFNEITRASFLSIAKTLMDKVNERSFYYSGNEYTIMARGRRKLALGFKREPDIIMGNEYGINFIEACRLFFGVRAKGNDYNKRRNTFCGRLLYSLPRDTQNYDLGVSKLPSGNFTAWFIISNFIFRLAEVKTRGEALIGCKMLHKAFRDLLRMDLK